jgi:hypothetical protein
MTTNVKNLEKFLNLNRNAKYRTLHVDWGNKGYFSTSFSESKFKKKKVKYSIEELSTIEQMKKSFYALYRNRKCNFCNNEDESFNHVWNCDARINELEQLKLDHFEILLYEINLQLKEKNIFLTDVV